MSAALATLSGWLKTAIEGWNRFWFAPSQPHTLAFIRIAGGLMLFYTHLVWLWDLNAFCGPRSWINIETSRMMNGEGLGPWSHLWYIQSPTTLYLQHVVGLVVMALLVVGWQTRIMSVAAWAITISYCHRLIGAQFGLDQINALIATYLMVGPSGSVWSVDRWLANRRAGTILPVKSSPWTTVAIRLMQLHMCIIYLFGGIGKMRGETWADGSALWYAFANLEYQSIDMQWTGKFPWLLALLSHTTVFWETFYPFLVWPRWSRPIALAMAFAVHAGIGLCLGMMTFGTVMIIGNCAFLDSALVEEVARRAFFWLPAAPQTALEAELPPPPKPGGGSVGSWSKRRP
jgi:hypothetical protein